MARRKQDTPTEVELKILQVLWDRGPSTVRQVVESLPGRPRAYTSVLTMLNVMHDKQIVTRIKSGRAHVYQAVRPKENTLGGIVQDVLGRAFEGSASSLIAHLLSESRPSPQELEQIQQAIDQYTDEQHSQERESE